MLLALPERMANTSTAPQEAQKSTAARVLLVATEADPTPEWVAPDGRPLELSRVSSVATAAARLASAAPDVVVVDSSLAAAERHALPRLRRVLGHAGILVLAEGYTADVARLMEELSGSVCLLPADAPARVQARLVWLVAERSGLARDLAERVAELESRTAELEESRARFRDVIERNADAIVVVDHLGIVRFANGMAAELFRTPRDELPGTPFGFPVVLGETTELDLPYGAEARVVEMRVVESGWEGETAYIASLRDVTDRKRSEEAARNLIREQAANRAKSHLLAVISHDLRTPLNAIMGYAQLLQMGLPDRLSEAGNERVERIRSSAMHLLFLIDELLSFARLDAGREEVRIADVEARAIVADVAAVAEPLAAERQLALRVAVPDGPVAMRTDPDRLRQILLNLVGNAIKYTESGEVALELEQPADGKVRFRVRDTGIGIDACDLERIFEPFWQVAPGQRSREEGTGLGLSVVRGLVRLLGGEISVESELGRGSAFSVLLPREDVRE
jgi:signal transduction histidine kinase